MASPSTFTYRIWYDAASQQYSITPNWPPLATQKEKWEEVSVYDADISELSTIIHRLVTNEKMIFGNADNLQFVRLLGRDLSNRITLNKHAILVRNISLVSLNELERLNQVLNLIKLKLSLAVISEEQEEKNKTALANKANPTYYTRAIIDYEWKLIAIPLK